MSERLSWEKVSNKWKVLCDESSRLSSASSPPRRAVRSATSKQCSRRGSDGWKLWRKIIPTCRCWPGLTPTWWKTPSSCLWEQPSSCECTRDHPAVSALQQTAGQRHTVVICVMSVVQSAQVDLMHDVVSSHQDRHLLPQSGGGRSKEDHRITSGADRKRQTSHAYKQLFLYMSIHRLIQQYYCVKRMFFLVFFVALWSIWFCFVSSLLRRERTRSFWSLVSSPSTSRNERLLEDSPVRSVFAARRFTKTLCTPNIHTLASSCVRVCVCVCVCFRTPAVEIPTSRRQTCSILWALRSGDIFKPSWIYIYINGTDNCIRPSPHYLNFLKCG